ncbi:monosaccharide ABC transporter ATP-binding protein, CUT2 family [Thalassovita litoralis]|jgi:simple sugar transport system ATP-binding protein|uniref:Monosaccharide ABC transporter ATP-binding protein, CUT2 family n=1 Tax=Thalassovita litoralis TaxID=1010611 RepID=A0A521BMB4_9RHOB|nr:sugar ABC transporter ATP-binding protein [Thalassovita litoralis]SMO48294.1 monosaccharide ABC transporter ATP-binding protein, CUT2 family [Thalassovita litoralis]
MKPVLEMRKITKLYGKAAAVSEVDFDLHPGEVHAILGENGAGKSTLTKMMAGVVHPTSGQILLNGDEINIRTPAEAVELGIAMVFQETSLVPSMTVAQNLFLGNEKFFNRIRGTNITAQQFMQSLSFDVDPTQIVASLGAAQKQMVEIARAMLLEARVIVFDEPTATLTPEEKRHFFNLVETLKSHSVAVIFISHALEEALEISDRITILRDGRHVVTDKTSSFNRDRIVQSMVGRELTQELYENRKTKIRPAGERILSIENLRVGGVVKNNSLSVFKGQVTGIFGLVGSGRTETFKVVSGVIKRNYRNGGEVILKGKPVRYLVPAQGVRDGIAYVTEDRKIEGFFETMSIKQNVFAGLMGKAQLARFWLRKSKMDELGEKWVKALQVKSVTQNANVIELSGGNQQKAVIAKSLVQEPELIIFDEPTRGVDVGAIAEIHNIINQLADEGRAVVVISSYLPEVMQLSDRLLVARQGKIVEEFSPLDATEEKLMYAAVH